MIQKFLLQSFLCVLLFNSPLFLICFEYDGEVYECSSRYSFYSTCNEHFSDNFTQSETWMEADDDDTLASFSEYLTFIPQCYVADCKHCYDCGGVGFNLYRGCYSPVEDSSLSMALTWQDLLYRHYNNRSERGWIYKCHDTTDHCEDLCWNGVYFRRWNHKYIHFFKHFLQYCSENHNCKCYWPEINKIQSNTNESVYILLNKLAEDNILKTNFSPYWKGTYYSYYEGKKVEPVEYFPNAHGMASSLTAYTFFYSQYHQMLLSVIEFIDADDIAGESATVIEKIYNCLEKLQTDFSFKYSYCLKRHPHPKILYELGMLEMHRGNYDNAFNAISRFMHLAKQKNISVSADMYHQEGRVYNELGMYDQAIRALTTSIGLDPTNRGAYFNRAQAYFETGNFDDAIKDYIASRVHGTQRPLLKTNIEIQDAILKGLLEGGKESAQNFFPSLCRTAYGLGISLWAFIEHPVESTTRVVNACYDISCNLSDFFKNVIADPDILIDEMDQVLGKIDRFSKEEKAYFTGFLVGKYGVDIFAGGSLTKCVAQYQKLKDANRMTNFEMLISSKETLKACAKSHVAKLQEFFKKITLNKDKQGKHIKGHKNYLQQVKNAEKTGLLPSILTHPDPEALIKEYAGTGKLSFIDEFSPGVGGFREVIECDKIIGECFDKGTKQYLPTKRATIHYDKDSSAHIVPTNPDRFKNS